MEFLEYKEKDLKNQIKGYRTQLEHEKKKDQIRTQAQTGMGATATSIRKYDKVRSIMFPFKTDPLGVTKYGAKADDIAYRVFDLKFE